ncbi:DNA repair protein RecN [Desulfuromonas thiophila]|uniref:DNA repair protein RecN n=1 Tax=Desulfuromonas thiophila TaxID=57664 RepID=UPI0029F5A450|nr:DNA repair protein RecN [Desulfuromonas thiophila]
MLCELMIRNLAVIEQVRLRFAPGFSVLSGETGAGKSIIIDAVGLLLGQRMRADMVRAGAEQGQVEALFDLQQQPQLGQWLHDNGLADPDDGASLLLKRVLLPQGKSRVYINGTLATVGQLQQVTAPLLAIFGQHEQQQLQQVDSHLALLEAYGDCVAARQGYAECYARLRTLDGAIAELQQQCQQRQQRQELLDFQCRELEQARLQHGEYAALQQERLRLQHGERLSALCLGGFARLYGDPGALCETLGTLAGQLEALQTIEPGLVSPLQAVRDALYGLEDAAAQLRQLGEQISFDAEQQERVEERLALLQQLQRKYQCDEDGLLARQQQLQQEHQQLHDSDSRLEQLRQQRQQAAAELGRSGEELSQRRRQAARRLCQAVETELAALAMPQARFDVCFETLTEPQASGLERAEFYFSANPGQPLKPLAATASGGELSRVMLALRKAAPGVDQLPTLIFDEVDAGIGGRAATAVGRCLKAVARDRQVLCVTHLPQVAAFADQQYRIEKQVEQGQTRTAVDQLDRQGRIAELSRMLGGAQQDRHSSEHARTLLDRSQEES